MKTPLRTTVLVTFAAFLASCCCGVRQECSQTGHVGLSPLERAAARAGGEADYESWASAVAAFEGKRVSFRGWAELGPVSIGGRTCVLMRFEGSCLREDAQFYNDSELLYDESGFDGTPRFLIAVCFADGYEPRDLPLYLCSVSGVFRLGPVTDPDGLRWAHGSVVDATWRRVPPLR